MYFYLVSPVILLIALLLYFKIAGHFNIIDKPNERSSHSYLTIRGGGVIFTIAVLIWGLVYGQNQYWLVFALFLMSLISFLDDVITLSSKIRLIIHFIAVSILFWQLQIFELPWYIIVISYLFTIGWINAFNFMDGINGITAFYGLTTLASFAWLNSRMNFVSQELIVVLIFSLLIFSFYNARKRAKTFAGDVGSVSLAFLLSWLMISLIIKSGRIEYILLFAVYGIDAVFTIIRRLIKGENIFEAHRSHLYQLLCNELKWPHVLVAALYSIIQLGINLIIITLVSLNRANLFVLVIAILILCLTYLLARFLISKRIEVIKIKSI